MHGLLIAESLRVGAALDDLRLTVTRISRGRAANTPDQPEVWTLVDFTADDAAADSLAQAFAGAIDDGPWYVNFNTEHDAYVVYAYKVFRYPRRDPAGRAEAQEYGRSVGVPVPQLDWTD